MLRSVLDIKGDLVAKILLLMPQCVIGKVEALTQKGVLS